MLASPKCSQHLSTQPPSFSNISGKGGVRCHTDEFNSITHWWPLSSKSMDPPSIPLRKPALSQHQGNTNACCDGGMYSSKQVQLWMQNYSNCNLLSPVIASMLWSCLKLRVISLTMSLPAGSTPRQHFNSSPSSYVSWDSYRNNVSRAECWQIFISIVEQFY